MRIASDNDRDFRDGCTAMVGGFHQAAGTGGAQQAARVHWRANDI